MENWSWIWSGWSWPVVICAAGVVMCFRLLSEISMRLSNILEELVAARLRIVGPQLSGVSISDQLKELSQDVGSINERLGVIDVRLKEFERPTD